MTNDLIGRISVIARRFARGCWAMKYLWMLIIIAVGMAAFPPIYGVIVFGTALILMFAFILYKVGEGEERTDKWRKP